MKRSVYYGRLVITKTMKQKKGKEQIREKEEGREKNEKSKRERQKN